MYYFEVISSLPVNASYKGVLFEKAKEVIDKSINIMAINFLLRFTSY